MAVPLHLLCFYLVLKERYLTSVFICGLLFYIHGQISLFTILPILTVIYFSRKRLAPLMKYLLFYILLTLPVGVALFLNFNPLGQSLPKYSIKELSMSRVPFHIFPDPKLITIFTSMMFSLILMLHMNKSKFKRELTQWNFSLMAIYFVGIIFTRFLPVDFIMLMYCLRVDVFLRIFFLIAYSIAFFAILKSIISEKSLREYYCFFLLIQVFFLVIIFFLSPLKLQRAKIRPPADDFTDICNYIKSSLPKNSLFITPPHIFGFRLYAQRSAVVDLKAHPIGRGNELQDEWMERLLSVCNVKAFEKRGFATCKECAYGFNSLTRNDFSSLCKKYKADYFVACRNGESALWEGSIYRNSGFALFACPQE